MERDLMPVSNNYGKEATIYRAHEKVFLAVAAGHLRSMHQFNPIVFTLLIDILFSVLLLYNKYPQPRFF
jgi:hypothetical protein